MRRQPTRLSGFLFLSTLAISSSAFALQEVEPQVPATPAAVEELVYARAFTLAQGYRWSSLVDEPEASRGVIVVLRVVPELVIPRNAPSPVLYAGSQVFQALNFGYPSGHVIGLIPGDVDLSDTPIWFGSPTTAALLSAELVEAELARALESGIRPFSAERIELVTRPAIAASSLDELLRGELAELVLQYAPEEEHLARKWRLPEATVGRDSTERARGLPEGEDGPS